MESRFIKDFIKVEISSKKRIGFNNLIKKSESIINNSRKIFSTSRLNKLLENFVNLNDLPSVNGKKIKLRYVHFGGINPTTFIVHANQDKKIPKNYIKYLEKSFRKKLNLESIQLNLIFRKSKNPFESKKNKLSNRQIKKKKRLIKFVKKTKK
jgi:GTP-binding protein